jgi:L-malate glycosyltransferase
MIRKHILFLLNSFDVGGTERYTYTLCSECKNLFESIFICSASGIWIKELDGSGINYIPILKMSKLSIIAFIVNILKIREVIKNNDIDIIHIQSRIFFLLLPFFNKPKIKIVYTSHCIFNDFFQHFIRADYILAISQHIKDNLVKTKKIPEESIIQIDNGVDCSQNEFDRSSSISSLGYIGRIEKDKGILILLHSVLRLKKAGVNIKLKIVGSGSFAKTIERFIHHNKLDDSVSIGNPTTDLNLLYKDFDMLVYPTIHNENLPLSVMEAMVYKKIVLVTRTVGNSGILKDGINCFLIKPLNDENLSEKILLIKSLSEKHLSSIRRNAYNMIKQNYNLKLMIEKYTSFYSNYL